MDTPTLILVVAIIALALIVAWLLVERRRTDRLRSRFGSEYRHAVDDTGDRRSAEAELVARQKRVAEFEIRPLSQSQRDRFASTWRDVQAQFVDEPAVAISRADDLIAEVMATRGYPVADFEQRVADVSVDHGNVVEHYRAAHDIAIGDNAATRDTEELRQAMVHYRALFDDLLEVEPGAGNGATRVARPRNQTVARRTSPTS